MSWLDRSPTLRANQRVMLAAATALSLAATPRALLHAQELPAGVAEELVDEALRRQLESPPREAPARPRQWAPPALAWFAIGLAVVMLVAGLVRGELRPRGSGGAAADAADAAKGDGATAGDPRADVPPEAGGGNADGRAPLVLPSHVTDVLERAAARRRHENGGEKGDDLERDAPDPEGGPTPRSLDLLVPGYDPWKGR